jgi:hypothetical protein
MTPTLQQSYELLSKYGCYIIAIYDKCGRDGLGSMRYTRKDDRGVWCFFECRGDGERQKVHKGGRPRKYKDECTRKSAHPQQQQCFRLRSRLTKTCQHPNERKQLTNKNLRFSHYPPSRALTPLESLLISKV